MSYSFKNILSQKTLFAFLVILLFLVPITGKDAIPPVIAQETQKIQEKPKAVENKPATIVKQAPQAHLVISKIGVNAVIQEMGLTSAGNMAVPGNRTEVGWFRLGTIPGNVGSAVIGGHNRFNSKDAVFNQLDVLEKGDIVSVVSKEHITTSFIVRDIRTYDATDKLTGVFDSEGSGIHLNLITCSGEWNPSTKSYTKRLMVFTDVINPTLAMLE